MFRIDDTTASPTLPAPAAAGTPGYFSDGNPSTATPPTTVPADWFNMIQEELITLLLAGGIAPTKTSHGQVLAAILALMGNPITGDIGAGHFEIPAIGLYVKFGTTALNSGANVTSTPIVFPAAFPNACLGIYGNADGPANSLWHPINICFPASGLSAAGATCVADTCNSTQSIAAGNNVRWLSIGR